MAGWYVRRGENVIGPIDQAKLKELAADGRLLPTDQLAKRP
jgi:GYF domain 2